MNFYKRYVGDIQRDTGHLSCAEMGVYDRLLDHYYATETPLPGDVDACCRIARAMDKIERKAVESILKQFFKLTEAGYTQSRTEKEIADAQPAMVSARLNGAKGGRPRKVSNGNQMGNEEKPNGFSENNPNETQLESSPEPEPDIPHGNTHSSDTGKTDQQKHVHRVLSAIKEVYDQHNKPLKGLSSTNPKFVACIEAGADVEEFVNAARYAVESGKEFAYIAGTVYNQRKDAKAHDLYKGPMPAANNREAGRSAAAAVIFKPEHTQHLQGESANQIGGEHEVKAITN
jgi:uncharacterized protein YdaU (DUF1376 family)